MLLRDAINHSKVKEAYRGDEKEFWAVYEENDRLVVVVVAGDTAMSEPTQREAERFDDWESARVRLRFPMN